MVTMFGVPKFLVRSFLLAYALLNQRGACHSEPRAWVEYLGIPVLAMMVLVKHGRVQLNRPERSVPVHSELLVVCLKP